MDYHFYREDVGGTWSHTWSHYQIGHGVSQKDAIGKKLEKGKNEPWDDLEEDESSKNTLMEIKNGSIHDSCARLIKGLLLLLMLLHSAAAAEEIEFSKAPSHTLTSEKLRELEVDDGEYHPEKAFRFKSPNVDAVVLVAQAGFGVVRQRISLYAKSNPDAREWDLISVVWTVDALYRLKLIDDKPGEECIVIRDRHGNTLAQFGLQLMGLYPNRK